MLVLKGITKDYQAGDSTVHALKGLDLCFRQSEFVAVLGPSGCGKTTLLNIVGGLDRYTQGDLRIGGKARWTSPTATGTATATTPSALSSRATISFPTSLFWRMWSWR